MKKPKVFVAMSGGVDSSVAAALLKKEGHFDIIGAHMICWKESILHHTFKFQGGALEMRGCGAEQDAEDARRVADKLDIPFYVFDFTEEYRKKVFDYMVREYQSDRTPNPDVMCNKEIKFGIFLEKALALGADFVATGHYVKAKRHSILQNTISLYQSKDKNKDQSYFLWTLTQNQLKRAIFPIGDYTKNEVREMARKFNLPTAEKKDSQGLCFVGKIDFAEFLKDLIPAHKGAAVSAAGRKIGEHDGTEFYTIGQRHGVGVGGGKLPLYVAQKDIKANIIVMVEKDNPLLYKKELIAGNVNWIEGSVPELPLKCQARVRYRQPTQFCRIEKSAIRNPKSEILKVNFDKPQRAVAPGQSVVFYDKKQVLGGGIIC
jgi:tRNA-uridine 2-sulfurtransferase